MQLATLRVELESENEVEQFFPFLRSTDRIFNLVIKLNWEATCRQATRLCHGIGKTVVLDIDGLTLGDYPQGCIRLN